MLPQSEKCWEDKASKKWGEAKNPPELLAQKMQQGTTEDGHNITKDNTKESHRKGGDSLYLLGKGHRPGIGVNSCSLLETKGGNRSDLLPPKAVIMKGKSMEA